MAKRKKTKTKKKNRSLGGFFSFSKNERGRKILAASLFLIAIFITLACLSYLFSWKADQDKVLQFSWDVVWQGDLQVENWLGRLGAIISHQVIYLGFGLPSLGFVFLLFQTSRRSWSGYGFKGFGTKIFYYLIGISFLSVLLSFIFIYSDFPWGGAFGDAMTHWLQNFIGSIGLFFLLLFVAAAYLIWLFNPSLEQLNIKSLWSELSWNTQSTDTNLSNDSEKEEPSNKKEEPMQSESDIDDEKNETDKIQTLDPSTYSDQSNEVEQESSNTSNTTNHIDQQFDMEVSAPENEEASEELEINTESAPIETIDELENSDDQPTAPYDPTADLSHFTFPSKDLLEQHDKSNISIDKEELEENKRQIIKTLYNYKIEITKIRATIGPTVTLYEIVPAPGVRISKIKNLEDDIALSLAALGIRIIAPIPGRGTIGIEVPNQNKQIVSLKQILKHEKYSEAKMQLPLALGKDISNEVFVADLAKMPHLLIAGATGQGKSVGINTILMSLLYKMHPSQLKLVLIDPKKVELFPYSKLMKHYLACLPNVDEPIITDTSKVVDTLASLCIEMDQRYDLLKNAHARSLKEYNKKFIERKLNPNKGHKYLPYIVLVIDEFADLIMTAGKEVELPIGRLAQLARAVGIHLIIATQRPSVNIITGIIKANFPARIAYKVTSKVDSRTILDAGGADQLIGRGDMLFSFNSSLIRLQCAFVDTPEVEKVLDHIESQQGYPEPYFLPEYSSEETNQPGAINADELDELFADAARLIVQNQHGSTSMIQRKLKLGYNRAGRIMDQLEHFGITGASLGSKPRDVLVTSMDELENMLESIEESKTQTPY